jgi:hypothetical protein
MGDGFTGGELKGFLAALPSSFLDGEVHFEGGVVEVRTADLKVVFSRASTGFRVLIELSVAGGIRVEGEDAWVSDAVKAAVMEAEVWRCQKIKELEGLLGWLRPGWG